MQLPEPFCPAEDTPYVTDLGLMFSISIKAHLFPSCLQHLWAGSAKCGLCESKFAQEKHVTMKCAGSVWDAVNFLHDSNVCNFTKILECDFS